MNPAKTDELLRLVRQAGILRPRDLDIHGIARVYLRDLCDRGLLVRSGRGLYAAADAGVTEHHFLAEACKRVPRGVVCLSSALRFHDLTTQDPWEVWLMIESGARVPTLDYPSLRIFRAASQPFHAGIKEHAIEGVPMRVYGLAKTVADCFRYRNKLGLDIAIEALRECLRSRRCTRDELHHYAQIDRVENVMRPYFGVVDVRRNEPKNLAASVRQRLLNLSRERREDLNFLRRYPQERLHNRINLCRRLRFPSAPL